MPIPFIAALATGGLWKWIVGGLILVAVVSTLWWAKSTYDNGKRREGAAKQAAIMQPLIDRAKAEADVHKSNLEKALRVNAELVETNKMTVALYKEQEAALVESLNFSKMAQEESRRARALIAERTKSHEARIVELLRRAQAPILVGENVCEEAAGIARDVLRQRLRNS